MDAATLIFVVLVILIASGYVQHLRGRRAGQTARFAVETRLSPDQLHRLAVVALKGYSPFARVRGSLTDGGYERRVVRWAAQATSRATAQVDVRGGPAGTTGSGSAAYLWALRGCISDWEIEHIAGMAHPLMSAPLCARRRLRALAAAILKADSTARMISEAS